MGADLPLVVRMASCESSIRRLCKSNKRATASTAGSIVSLPRPTVVSPLVERRARSIASCCRVISRSAICQFEEGVQEIFAMEVLPGVHFPNTTRRLSDVSMSWATTRWPNFQRIYGRSLSLYRESHRKRTQPNADLNW